MSDERQLNDLSQIPEAVVEKRRRRSSQLIWIIPVIAAIIGASLAVKSWIDRGAVITITFKNGEGIEAGKTRIKYKDVQIGEVKSVTIAKDRSNVIVTAEVSKDAAWLLVEGARFWVVRARVSRNNISGLGTLMEGAYIGVETGVSKQPQNEFAGLERPPAIAMDDQGRQFVLRATGIGSLDISSPILYRRIQVGEVVDYELDKDGKGVTLKAFVRAPYDQYVRTNTLFWHASGMDLSIDADGVTLNTESMVTILLGGISFLTPEDPQNAQPAAPPGSSFALFDSKDEAVKRLDAGVERYTLMFAESVRGLVVGAPVDLRGVTVGEVTSINIDLDPRNNKIVMPVEVHLYPERMLGSHRAKSRQDKPMNSRQLLDLLVSQGFRAQLLSRNLLTGQLYVALDFFPKAAPDRMDWSKNPPEFPTITGNMEQFKATLMQIVQKIEKLPLEELVSNGRQTIRTIEATLKSAEKLLRNLDTSLVPEARSILQDVHKTLADVRKTLEDARGTLGGAKQTLSPDAPLQNDLRETLRELSRAAQSLRVLGDYLERHPESLIRGKEEER